MSILAVTAKGQITLRKEVLQHLGIKPGDKIEVDLLPNHTLSIRPKRTGSIDTFIGSLYRPGGPSLSVDEIKAITENAWAGKR